MMLPVAVAHSSSLLCSVQLGERICSVAGRVGGFQFAVFLSSAAVNIILCLLVSLRPHLVVVFFYP